MSRANKTGWHAMMTLCVICSRKWLAVFPNAADFTKLECPSCGAQNSMPIPRDETEADPAEDWKQL